MARPKTQVPVKQEASKTPAYFNGYNETGTESIDPGDVSFPRIKIVQSLSKVKRSNDKIKDGEFYDTATGISMGKSILIYPVLHWISRVWFDDNMGFRATEWRTPSGETRRSGNIDWSNESDYATGWRCQNYYVTTVKSVAEAVSKGIVPDIFILSFTSSASQCARQINTKLKTNGSKGIPIWGQQIKLTTQIKEFPKGHAYLPQPAFGPFATKEEAPFLDGLYKQAKNYQESASCTHGANEDDDQAHEKKDDDFVDLQEDDSDEDGFTM